MLTAVLALHLVAALIAAPLSKPLRERVFLVCALAPLAGFVALLVEAPGVIDGTPVVASIPWAASLGLEITLRLDGFGLTMGLLVTGIGVLVLGYSRWYFDHSTKPGLGRFAGTLTLFAGAMLGLVSADNVFGLFLFWELTSVCSYLLIGFEDTRADARKAALQALLTTGLGGLALLGGLVLLSQATGTTSLFGILAAAPTSGPAQVGYGLVLLGAATKSAQVPFHMWLPGAMAAPSPVSAYLHSATMVKAGVVLVARFGPVAAAASTAGWWRWAALALGMATLVLGAWRALRQHDLKRLLAFGTISQLGLMVALFGVGLPEATLAGVVVLVGHGLYKAALFMSVGIIDHQAHSRDIRRLSGLGSRMPVLAVAVGVTAASMAGVPLVLGFIGKELALDALLVGGFGGDRVALWLLVAASMLTVAGAWRLWWGSFATKAPVDLSGEPVGAEAPRPSVPFVAPVVILAALTLVFGVLPGLLDSLVGAAAGALDAAGGAPVSVEPELALWHGFTVYLILSLLALAGGAVLILLRRPVERFGEGLGRRLSPLVDAQEGFDGLLAGTLRGAGGLTAIVQNGSLPIYLTVILVVAVALPGTALALGGTWPGGFAFSEGPLQVVSALTALVGAVAVALSRRRRVAVVLIGIVGYSVAVLFVVQGAPDLALTQLLIETLTLVIFVLVLRQLPDRFTRRPFRVDQLGRLALSLAVGVFVTVFALMAVGSRVQDPVGDLQAEVAQPQGGGKNVVNVILIDIRGADTMGEITVLAVTAVGVIALVGAGRRRNGSDDDAPGGHPDSGPGSTGDLTVSAGETAAQELADVEQAGTAGRGVEPHADRPHGPGEVGS